MISNDVNVIFAFLDVKHIFHQRSKVYILTNRRRKYILLAQVMKSFLITYQDYVKEVGDVIFFEIMGFKQRKTTVKKFSNDSLISIIEPSINKQLDVLSQKYPSYSYDSLNDFKKMLLTEFSIPELIHEEESLDEFKEKFIEQSLKFSEESLNEFLNVFTISKMMKMEEYSEYNEMLKKVKLNDYEDRKICTELFCFGTQKGKIRFLTFDKKFFKYLEKHGSGYNVAVV